MSNDSDNTYGAICKLSNPCSMLMYRSDGKEVLVDDKELKANNPLLV